MKIISTFITLLTAVVLIYMILPADKSYEDVMVSYDSMPVREHILSFNMTTFKAEVEKIITGSTNVFMFPVKANPAHQSTVNLYISSEYGWRSMGDANATRVHAGGDIAGGTNALIIASAPGKVVFNGDRGSYGWAVMIDAEDGIRYEYNHMKSKSDLAMNAEVKTGDVIGIMGRTGKSTGIHLHYNVKVGGVYVNPWTLEDVITTPTYRDREFATTQHGKYRFYADDSVARIDLEKVKPQSSGSPPLQPYQFIKNENGHIPDLVASITDADSK